MDSLADLDVGIVHEWLTNRAGSERCVEALLQAFPSAHVYTSLLDPTVFGHLSGRVSTSRLQSWLGRRNGHLAAGPLLPLAMRSLDVRPDHAALIYSFHHFATWARRPPGVPSVIYCYTPPRFIYRAQTMAGERGLVRFASRLGSLTRPLDHRAAGQADGRFVAISSAVARRVRDAYGVEAEIVHPPVDVGRFAGTHRCPGDYFLFVGRLVPYKRADLVIDAFRSLPYRLVIAGDGRLRASLERDAPRNVSFLGHVADEDLPALVAGATGFVFPGEEDFGIAPVEALAAGTPVIAFAAGGALDYVRAGVNGILVDDQTAAAFAAAVRAAAGHRWDVAAISASASGFSEERFVAEMRGEVQLAIAGSQ